MDERLKELKKLKKKINSIVKFNEWFDELDKIDLKNILNNLSQDDFDKRIEILLFITWMEAYSQDDESNKTNG